MRFDVQPSAPARPVTQGLAILLLVAGAVSTVGCSGPTSPSVVVGTQIVTDQVGFKAKPECCKEDQATESAKTDANAKASANAVPQRITLVDVPLVDQTGRTVMFASELVGRRVAAVEFIFTRCSTTCPLLGIQFQRVQSLLAYVWGGGPLRGRDPCGDLACFPRFFGRPPRSFLKTVVTTSA